MGHIFSKLFFHEITRINKIIFKRLIKLFIHKFTAKLCCFLYSFLRFRSFDMFSLFLRLSLFIIAIHKVFMTKDLLLALVALVFDGPCLSRLYTIGFSILCKKSYWVNLNLLKIYFCQTYHKLDILNTSGGK